MDLIITGRYIDIFYAKTCATTKISTVAGYHVVLATLLLDGDVPRSTSYGVYISQLIRFARVSSHVVDFNARNKSLTAKLLQQGYRYHKLRKTFSKFYRRHYELVSKFNVGLKRLLHQGLSEPEFYADLVYKFKKKCRYGWFFWSVQKNYCLLQRYWI